MSGKNGELTFLDIISVLGFLIGLENYELNVTQADLQNESKFLDKELRSAVKDIHEHLSVQDAKINLLMEGMKRMEDKYESHTVII